MKYNVYYIIFHICIINVLFKKISSLYTSYSDILRSFIIIHSFYPVKGDKIPIFLEKILVCYSIYH